MTTLTVAVMFQGPNLLTVTRNGDTLKISSKRGASFDINLSGGGSSMPWLSIPHILSGEAFSGTETSS